MSSPAGAVLASAPALSPRVVEDLFQPHSHLGRSFGNTLPDGLQVSEDVLNLYLIDPQLL